MAFCQRIRVLFFVFKQTCPNSEKKRGKILTNVMVD